ALFPLLPAPLGEGARRADEGRRAEARRSCKRHHRAASRRGPHPALRATFSRARARAKGGVCASGKPRCANRIVTRWGASLGIGVEDVAADLDEPAHLVGPSRPYIVGMIVRGRTYDAQRLVAGQRLVGDFLRFAPLLLVL